MYHATFRRQRGRYDEKQTRTWTLTRGKGVKERSKVLLVNLPVCLLTSAVVIYNAREFYGFPLNLLSTYLDSGKRGHSGALGALSFLTRASQHYLAGTEKTLYLFPVALQFQAAARLH